jgi:hypothetical protein
VISVAVDSGRLQNLTLPQDCPGPIAVDSMSVYWATGGAVSKVGLAGGQPVTLVALETGPTSLAVDDKSAYWAMPFHDRRTGTVMKVALDGNAPTIVASDQGSNFSASMAVDGTSVYWTDRLRGTVMKLTPK